MPHCVHARPNWCEERRKLRVTYCRRDAARPALLISLVRGPCSSRVPCEPTEPAFSSRSLLRFAAADISTTDFLEKAVAITISGGAAAAVVGGEICQRAQWSIPHHQFAGVYLIMICLFATNIVVLYCIDFTPKPKDTPLTPFLPPTSAAMVPTTVRGALSSFPIVSCITTAVITYVSMGGLMVSMCVCEASVDVPSSLARFDTCQLLHVLSLDMLPAVLLQ